MQQSFPLSLSLMDFLPPIAFLVGAVFIYRLAKLKQMAVSAWLISIGGSFVFLGGFLKAVWKFLVTIQVADIQILSEQQFALLAPGFGFMFLGVLVLVSQENRTQSVAAFAPWKLPFLITMTIMSVGVDGLLTYYAFQKSARFSAWMFILAMLCLFIMSGLASGEQTIALQWIAQSVNLIGQTAFAIGSIFLFREHQSIPSESGL